MILLVIAIAKPAGGGHNPCASVLLTLLLICSLAEELVTAAQAVESGKGLERKLSSLQTEYDKVIP